MSGDWMKVELDLPDKPEVFRIASILSLDPDSVVGKLIRVWSWFDKHTEDGNAKASKVLIDRLASAQGFADAMISSGWLFENGDSTTIPKFDKHNGKSAKLRSETARRVAKHRVKSNAPVTESRLLPRPIVRIVMERDKKTCRYCGRKEGEYCPPETAGDASMCIDHVMPFARGGGNEISNLVCACSACNKFKSDRTPDECNLDWPLDVTGIRMGSNEKNVTNALPREEKRREDTKEKKARKHATPISENFAISKSVADWAKAHGFTRLPERLEFFIGYAKANGKTYADWDQAFQNSIRGDWAKLNGNGSFSRQPPPEPAYVTLPRMGPNGEGL